MSNALILPERWTPLRYHEEQQRLWTSPARFKVTAAGRRSGKTELEGKRNLIMKAIEFDAAPNGWFVAAAPTYAQAKEIFWQDLKAMVPPMFIATNGISETGLTIKLITGTEISVRSLDKPERLEGRAIDGISIDEIANAKQDAWKFNIRPALDTPGRPGWASLFGVPEGRNFFHQIALEAQKDQSGDWDYFHWLSEDILSRGAIEAAKRDMDPLTYAQEYEASFVSFQGKAYYQFNMDDHQNERVLYNPNNHLVFCFDFNVSPGVAVVCQEYQYKGDNKKVAHMITAVIDEVWIPQHSNTQMVCRKLIEKYGDHKLHVMCYGDATGGAQGSAKVLGSDWELIDKELRRVFPGRLRFNVPDANPRERVRVNALNSRLKSSDGVIHLLVDPVNAEHVVNDFEGVMIVDGSAGELLKPPKKGSDPERTHVTDALGYYIEYKYPVSASRLPTVVQV